MASCGIWKDHWKDLSASNSLISNTKKGRKSFGTLQPTLWVKLQKSIMAAISALAHLRLMVSTMRWLLTTGMFLGLCVCSGNVCSDSFRLFLVCAGDSSVVPADYGSLETLFKGAVKEKQPFERLVVSKEKLLEMFAVRLFIPSREHEFVHPERCTHTTIPFQLLASTTNIKCTSSIPKSQMVHPRRYTAVGP